MTHLPVCCLAVVCSSSRKLITKDMDSLFSSSKTFHYLTILSERVLKNVKMQDGRDLKDSDLIALHSIYGDVVEKALLLVDSSTITTLVTEDRRLKIYQVIGSSGLSYTLYPDINYCECSAFKYHVCKTDPVFVTCKHILAAHLAEIMGRCKEEIVTNSSYVETILLSALSSDGPL